MGCKGPDTFSPCPIVKWNGGVSFPIQSGHPCIGCTELYFFDRMTPFYKTLPNVNGFGVEASANIIGAVGVAAPERQSPPMPWAPPFITGSST